jgi:MFS transporter, AAHS family, 4-hydroxybenzoate transporter
MSEAARSEVARPVAPEVVDVGAVIDNGRWSTYQKVVMGLVASTIVLDGFDNQVLGFAIPAIIKEWGVTRGDFTPIVACGLVGMGLGTAFAGVIGDKVGRRPTLLASVLLFALATLGIAFAHDLTLLAALRFLAGFGVGGALPNAAAMTAEFTPARNRAVAVTSTIVCVPLGGIFGGLLAAKLLPSLGWRSLFIVGGFTPLVLLAVLVFLLPESPRFLARQAKRAGELAKLLGRCGFAVPAGARLVDLAESKTGEDRGGVSALFSRFYRRDTIALWVAFFFTQMAVYTVFSWIPTMLSGQGLTLATASTGLTAYNFGGVIGALSGAALISVFGSRKAMLPLALGGSVTAGALVLIPITPAESHLALVSLLAAHGFFVNAVQTTMYALVAHVYLTNVRTTGSGMALGIGRLGAILSSFVGASVLSVGPNAYYQMLLVAMLGSFIGLAIVRRHIPSSAAT